MVVAGCNLNRICAVLRACSSQPDIRVGSHLAGRLILPDILLSAVRNEIINQIVQSIKLQIGKLTQEESEELASKTN